MKDRICNWLIVAAMLFLIGAGVREMLIHNGRLTTDLNADGHSITNLPDGFFPDVPVTSVNGQTGDVDVPVAGNYASVSNAAMKIYYVEFDDLWYGWYFSGMAQRARSAVSLYDANSNHYLSHSNSILEPNLWGDFANGIFRPFAYASELADAARDATNYVNLAKSDIAPTVSNTVTKAYVEGLGISSDESDPVWEAEKSGYATHTDVQSAAQTAASNAVGPVMGIVDSWESYWGATNVELRVTNYYGNTTGALPRLQIREFRDGHWTNVWDEIDKFIACKAEILHDVAKSNETVLAECDRKYAPKAWGSHTDKGTTNVIPNSVYMTSPETYFGGGTEFQRVAVGSGAVSVLVDRGALAKTTGEPGTFRFQDAGGTNYFGFVKSDSYTIGCRTDGISVGAGNAITLRYDVIMSGEDVPVVYWKQQLESATPWAQLNNPDGTAADGAPYAVTWLQDGGSYYATVNCGGSPSGFFVAETSVAGDVVWETNMKARLGGGIECTNTATHATGVIRPKYNGSTVTWEWSAR